MSSVDNSRLGHPLTPHGRGVKLEYGSSGGRHICSTVRKPWREQESEEREHGLPVLTLTSNCGLFLIAFFLRNSMKNNCCAILTSEGMTNAPLTTSHIISIQFKSTPECPLSTLNVGTFALVQGTRRFVLIHVGRDELFGITRTLVIRPFAASLFFVPRYLSDFSMLLLYAFCP